MDCSTPGFPITNSRSLFNLMVIESVMPSNHLILCHLLLLLLSILPSRGLFQISPSQGLLQWVSSSLQVAKVLELQLPGIRYTVHGILQARILEWVAFPFSRGSSQPRDRTQVSHSAGGFFTNWAIREAQFVVDIVAVASSHSFLWMSNNSLYLFILSMGFSRQEYWSGLPFPSPVDHILSELSTMTCLSWVALHTMVHSFIFLDRAVIHVIRLVSFLWLWFSVCLPSDGEG